MKRTFVLLSLIVLAAGMATAHEGVKNPAVMARMQAMSQIGNAMKTLGQMAKGQVAFDAGAARTAADQIARFAAETPALFQAEEDDPKSEAKPEIWMNFKDFTSISEALETAAKAASADMANVSDVQSAMQSMGQTCAACHKAYRK